MILIMQQYLSAADGKALVSCSAVESTKNIDIGFDVAIDYDSDTIDAQIITQAVIEFGKLGVTVKETDCRMLK